MLTGTTKQRIIDQLREERAVWEAVVAAVGEEWMDLPGAMGDWTMKDAIAHLTTWWRWHVARAAAQRRGEPLPEHPPGAVVPLINDWVRLVNRDRPIADVLRDARSVWDQLEELIQATPERELLDARQAGSEDERELGPNVVDRFMKHLHERHEPAIRDWLARLAR